MLKTIYEKRAGCARHGVAFECAVHWGDCCLLCSTSISPASSSRSSSSCPPCLRRLCTVYPHTPPTKAKIVPPTTTLLPRFRWVIVPAGTSEENVRRASRRRDVDIIAEVGLMGIGPRHPALESSRLIYRREARQSPLECY